jgi:hypothetical protein
LAIRTPAFGIGGRLPYRVDVEIAQGRSDLLERAASSCNLSAGCLKPRRSALPAGTGSTTARRAHCGLEFVVLGEQLQAQYGSRCGVPRSCASCLPSYHYLQVDW